MDLQVREMHLDEVDIRIDYFHDADVAFLEMMGVDQAKLPARKAWRKKSEDDYARPIEQRESIQLLWLEEGVPFGFSTADIIEFGSHANMHLHVLDKDKRRSGRGVECVRQSAMIYVSMLGLKRLCCRPNAFNTAPNRTLQKAGFKYVKTFETIPGLLNFHQVVNQWELKPDML